MTSSLTSTGRNNYVSNVSSLGNVTGKANLVGGAKEDDFARSLLTSVRNR